MDTPGKAYMGVPMERRKRRAFTKEFKAETVRLVREGGRSIAEVARDLDLTESALRAWVRQAEVDSGQGSRGELTTAEREELQRLRREVKALRLEREILKKAASAERGRDRYGGATEEERERASLVTDSRKGRSPMRQAQDRARGCRGPAAAPR